MKIGFIGLGRMGTGMAANLLKHGHELTVYNRSAEKLKPLTDAGAHAASNVADACRGEAVITMLADDNAVESTTFAANGILASLGKGAIHISMSTIGVALSEKLAAAHTNAGQRYVSAPVFGRPAAAAAAKLYVLAAGAPDATQDCAPIFESLGQSTLALGPKPEIANLVKLSGNFLIASVVESLGEAIALVSKAGVDRKQYVEFLTTTLFNAPAYKTYGGMIADEKYSPAGFAAPLGLKDVRLTLAAAETLQVAMPVASLLRDRFLTLLATGGADLDWSAIAQLAARDAGTK